MWLQCQNISKVQLSKKAIRDQLTPKIEAFSGDTQTTHSNIMLRKLL